MSQNKKSAQSLNNSSIKAATVGTVLHDKKVSGLQMRVSKNKKSFFLYYRTRTRQERRPKIGDWPTISLDQAREIACGWLESVSNGKDPVAEWRDAKNKPTMGDLSTVYIDEYLPKKKHSANDLSIIRKYIIPELGSVFVADLQLGHIEKLHKKMESIPYMANRTRACLSTMLAFAEKKELRPRSSNPCQHVDKYKEAKRKRYLRPGEAREVYDRLAFYENKFPGATAFIWLLIYTGARPSEIAAARSDQRQGNRFELTQHKTDHTGITRVIFLPPQAVEVLDRLGKTPDGSVTGIKSPRCLWRKIVTDKDHLAMGRAEPKPLENLRIYDLRHSFASAALMSGLSLDQIGELLGHNSSGTTKRYAHLMEELGVAKATQAADFLDKMVKDSVT